MNHGLCSCKGVWSIYSSSSGEEMAVDLAPGYVRLRVTSTLTSLGSESRYPTSTTIGDLKGKLELVTGATASLCELQLYDSENKLLRTLDDDNATLSSFQLENDFRIHVINKDPTKTSGEFDDVSKVEKYEISEEAYAKKTDSVRAFKQRMKLGRFADKDPVAEAEAAAKEQQEKEETEAILIGARCEVTLAGSSMAKRGTVMFAGKTEFKNKSGYFVGVKYDEPLGKNDGSVEGKRYFECPPKYGVFVKAKFVTVGDFPEETFSDDEM